jgi:EAL domain-containing protein (putative c-di-GMP-specific phosphodiesterase class I)
MHQLAPPLAEQETPIPSCFDEELVLHYQPVFDAFSRRPLGVEALIRWDHPSLGLLPPGDFLPGAERAGLAVPIGRWVLHTAIREIAAWQRRLGAIELSVNVSAEHLADPSLPGDVAHAAELYGLRAGTLTLELTETTAIDEATVLRAAAVLRAAGVCLALDDFGTGYASLEYLRRFPLDAVKVDRSFVAGVDRHPEDRAIVRAIGWMARASGLGVVAEGVETEAQLAQVRSLGCERAQGFLLACPMPGDQAAGFIGGFR